MSERAAIDPEHVVITEPVPGQDGAYAVDATQEAAIDFFRRRMK